MAKNDELDSLLTDSRVNSDEWEALDDILEIKNIMSLGLLERQKVVNKEIRHNAIFKLKRMINNEYDPDYVPILRDAAK